MQFDPEQEKTHLGLLFLTLLIPQILYLAREFDDNRLTSWSWVFGAVAPVQLFLVLLVTAPLLWWLSGSSIPTLRQPLVPAFAAFSLSLLFFDIPEVIVDASRYFVQAKLFREHGALWFSREWGREVFAWTDLPLIPSIYGLLFKLFGEFRLIAQLANAAFFATSTYLICLLGRDLWDEETGMLAGFLMLGFPFLYTQVPLLLVDVGTMTFLLLAMVTWYRALIKGGALHLTLANAALTAAFLVKYSAWLLLTGLGPLLIMAALTNPPLVLRRAIMATLPALIIVGLVFVAHWEVMSKQLELLSVYQKPGLNRWGESLSSTFLFQTHPLITAGAIYSGFRAWSRRDGRFLVIAFLPALLLGFMEVRRIRYTLPIFPMIALLAAYGFQGVRDRRVRRHLAMAVVVPSLILAWGAFRPFLLGMGERNLQEAGAYLNHLDISEATVIILPNPEPVLDSRVSIPILDIFTTKQLYYDSFSSEITKRSDQVATSPLRFTWEFPLPAIYSLNSIKAPEAVVVISAMPNQETPPISRKLLTSLPQNRTFLHTDEVFLNQTFVAVFHH